MSFVKTLGTLSLMAFAAGITPTLNASDTSTANSADPAAANTVDASLKRLMASAQKQRANGKLFDAIESFETILSQQPSLHRARLELALTHYALLNLEEARYHARLLLDDPEISASSKQSINKLLNKLDKREQQLSQRHTWKRRIGTGLSYDDNVNVGPSSDVIEIGDQSYQLKQDYLPRSDTAHILSLGITHRFQNSRTYHVGQKAARGYWQSEFALYRKDYQEENNFNLDTLSFSTGPALIAPKYWRASLKLRADDIRYGGDEYALHSSLNPNMTWLFSNGEIAWDSSLMRREYQKNEDSDRTSDYLVTGLTLARRYLDSTVALKGGVKIFKEDARDGYYSNDGYESFVGVSYQPRPGISLYTKLTRKDIEYDGTSTLFGTNRDEQQYKTSVGAVYRMPKGIMDGLRLRADYTHTERESNISVYDYDRDQATLSLEYRF